MTTRITRSIVSHTVRLYNNKHGFAFMLLQVGGLDSHTVQWWWSQPPECCFVSRKVIIKPFTTIRLNILMSISVSV